MASKPARSRATAKKPSSGRRTKSPPRAPSSLTEDAQTDPSVDAFLKATKHPLRTELKAVRQWILEAAPDIREAIKWNAPSFKTTDFFATFQLRSMDQVELIFHTGAKVKATAKSGLSLADPTGLVKWVAKDRGRVTLGAGRELASKKTALQDLVREWIRWL